MDDRTDSNLGQAPHLWGGTTTTRDATVTTTFRANTRRDLPRIAEKLRLSRDQLTDMRAVSAVLPFRVNDYVIEHLIDPDSVPHAPLFQLPFPQRGAAGQGAVGAGPVARRGAARERPLRAGGAGLKAHGGAGAAGAGGCGGAPWAGRTRRCCS